MLWSETFWFECSSVRSAKTAVFHSVVCPATSTAASGTVMSCCSSRNVIVAKGERGSFAANYESLPIGRQYRFVDTPQLCSSVTLRDLIEREGEGSWGSLRGWQRRDQQSPRKVPRQNPESHTFAM